MPTGALVCTYDLDADSRIVAVDEGWSAFARRNDALELLPPGVLGHAVLSSITDPTTRDLYRALFETVRASGEPAALPFRCDSPSERRYFLLHIEPLPAHGLRLWSEVLESAPRTAVPLLERNREHADAVLLLCSWCKSVNVDGRWYSIEDAVAHLGLFEQAVLPQLSHGICDACVERLAGPE